jgi:hypothetical protein
MLCGDLLACCPRLTTPQARTLRIAALVKPVLENVVALSKAYALDAKVRRHIRRDLFQEEESVCRVALGSRPPHELPIVTS